MPDREPVSDQRVQCRSDGAVLLDHAFGKPVGNPCALDGIAVDRPGLAAFRVDEPIRARRGHVDRVLDREDETRARRKRSVHASREPAEILDVMQGERAEGEIEGGVRQLQLFEIRNPVFDTAVVRRRSGAGKHVFGNVEAEHVRRSVLSRPAGEPAKPAAEVDDALAVETGHQHAERRPLRRAVETVDRPRQPAVAGEELGIVVDILCHVLP
jgi:hypothetical protein